MDSHSVSVTYMENCHQYNYNAQIYKSYVLYAWSFSLLHEQNLLISTNEHVTTKVQDQEGIKS